jgi:hypothetical protein
MLQDIAGFLLPQVTSRDSMTYRQLGGMCGGISKSDGHKSLKYRQ